MVSIRTNISSLVKKEYILVLFLSFFLFQFSFSQDVHFSQFYASPLTMNPANTGNFDGDWRFCNSYRNQWRSLSKPFITNAISFDRRINIYGHKLSAGIIWVNDKSGNINLIVNKIMVSATYEKSIQGNTFLGGVQFGYTNRTFSLNNLTMPSQYDKTMGQFNSGLSNSETDLNDNSLYPDLNLGIFWRNSDLKIQPEAGIAIFHANKPNPSFFTSNDKLPSRQVFHVGLNYPIATKIILEPKLFYMSTSKATDLLIGSNADLLLSDNKYKIKSIFGGLYLRDGYKRNTDAFYLVGGVKVKDFIVGISYDINISDMHVATQYRGAFEISLIYTSLNTFINKISIPCDIY